MGKKKVEEMQKQRDSFVKGCATTNKIPAAKANQIFDLLEKFAGYGFQQIARRRLRHRCLPDGVFKGELSGGIFLRHDDQ